MTTKKAKNAPAGSGNWPTASSDPAQYTLS